MFAWDVVNEAVDKNGLPRSASLWSAIGSPVEYMSLAFETAKKCDPKAELFYNDYGIEEVNRKSDALFSALSEMKSKGVPIDLDSVRKNMKRFSDLGLKIHITEFDYALSMPPRSEALGSQALAYYNFAALCVSMPVCEAFVSWGFTDAHSWIPAFSLGRGGALYFDEKYRPKRPYHELLRAFK